MANKNGLIGVTSVGHNGAVSANIWAKKINPELQGNVDFISPDGTKVGTIQQNDNGNMVMYSDTAGALYLGTGGVFFPSPDETKNCELVIENDGDVGFYPGSGATLFLGGSSGSVALQNLSTSPQIRVGAQNGIVYDSYYNKPTVVTSVTSYSGVATPLTYSNTTFSLTPGSYMLQMFAETVVPQVGTRLRLFVLEPNPSSQLVNYGAASIAYDSTSIAEFSASTGIFEVATAGDYKLNLQSSGANWTATQWGIQLVKVA